MTMLVLINYKDGVMLAADKRAVWKNGGKVTRILSDDVDKIYSWNGGYIAGSGYAPLLENVKNFVSSNTINDIDEITEYLKRIIQNNSIHQHWIDTTNFALIYCTSSDFRSVVLSSKSYETRAFVQGSVEILINGIDTDLFKNQLKKEIACQSINVHNVIDILRRLFKFVSSKDNTVSTGFDFSMIDITGKAIVNIEN